MSFLLGKSGRVKDFTIFPMRNLNLLMSRQDNRTTLLLYSPNSVQTKSFYVFAGGTRLTYIPLNHQLSYDKLKREFQASSIITS